MDLENLQEVKIEPGAKKYIVAVVSDASSNNKTIIRATKTIGHSGIVGDLCREAAGLSVKCIGGGFIDFWPEGKFLSISGSSREYGREPDRDQTVAILQKTFPDFKVDRIG